MWRSARTSRTSKSQCLGGSLEAMPSSIEIGQVSLSVAERIVYLVIGFVPGLKIPGLDFIEAIFANEILADVVNRVFP